MRELIKEQRRTPRTNQIFRYMKQAIAAVLAVVVVTFGGLMTVEAYRERVIGIVVQIFEEFTQYRFSSNASEQVDTEQSELPEIQFGYIPEGVRETENRVSSAVQRRISYEDNQNHFFELTEILVVNGKHDMILDTVFKCCWEESRLCHLMFAVAANRKEQENRYFSCGGNQNHMRCPETHAADMQIIKVDKLIQEVVLHSDTRRGENGGNPIYTQCRVSKNRDKDYHNGDQQHRQRIFALGG